jgi:hypothetical protein
MFELITVGLDLAKNVFQLHGADACGRAVLRRKQWRGQVLEALVGLSSCTVAMDACGGAHFPGREIGKPGLEVRPIPSCATNAPPERSLDARTLRRALRSAAEERRRGGPRRRRRRASRRTTLGRSARVRAGRAAIRRSGGSTEGEGPAAEHGAGPAKSEEKQGAAAMFRVRGRPLIPGAGSVVIERQTNAVAQPGTWMGGLLARKPGMPVRAALANSERQRAAGSSAPRAARIVRAFAIGLERMATNGSLARGGVYGAPVAAA